ncbi:MAG: hypothetical protein PHW74_06200 [Desulfobacca sp.]|nr:hypothetical protein [Desulfobacca sp.]
MTIALDEEIARWARTRAAERHQSVSRLVEEILREKMTQEEDYLRAMQQYLAIQPQALKKSRDLYVSRNKLHER